MPNSEDKVSAWLMRMLMLLPGFISLAIAQYIVGQGKLTEFEIVSYSLVLSLASFLLALGFYRLTPLIANLIRTILRRPWVAQGEARRLPSFSLRFSLLVLGAAILVGCCAGYVYADDVVLRSLRSTSTGSGIMRISFYPPLTHLMVLNQRARIGERDGRPAPLDQQEAWVVLFTKSGKRIEGYPMLFSVGDGDRREIYLSPACLTESDLHPWPGPGILVRESEIESIGFIDGSESRCLGLWTPRDSMTGVSPNSPVGEYDKNDDKR